MSILDQTRNYLVDKFGNPVNNQTNVNTTYVSNGQPVLSNSRVNTYTTVPTGYTTGYTNVPNTTYTTGQQVLSNSHVNTYATRPATYTTGQTVVQNSYSTVPTDYKMVNQTFATSTGGYSRIGGTAQNLVQKVVAEEIPVESRIEYIPF